MNLGRIRLRKIDLGRILKSISINKNFQRITHKNISCHSTKFPFYILPVKKKYQLKAVPCTVRNIIRLHSIVNHKESNHLSAERFYSSKEKQFISHKNAMRKKRYGNSHAGNQSITFNFLFDDAHILV